MKSSRLTRMERYIQERGFVTVTELCDAFQIHPNTARSDIRALVDSGVALKKYGGVSAVKRLSTDYQERARTNIESKEAIGRTAALLLEEGDVIYLDAGSTAFMLLKCASGLPKQLTVVTSSLSVVNWVAENTNYPLHVLPGEMDRRTNSIQGVETVESIKSYKISKAFIGIRGVSGKGELLSASGIDAGVKKTLCQISDRVILLADAEKVKPTNAVYSYFTLEKVDTWVCDRATEKIGELCRQFHVKLLTP